MTNFAQVSIHFCSEISSEVDRYIRRSSPIRNHGVLIRWDDWLDGVNTKVDHVERQCIRKCHMNENTYAGLGSRLPLFTIGCCTL